MRRTAPFFAGLLALPLVLAGCDDEPAAEPETPATQEPAEEPTAEAEATEPPGPPEDNSEACARMVMVAWQGAAHAPETITRSKEEARERAEALRARVEGGEALAEVAREESDAPSSAARGGAIGTFAREDWPALHGALEEPLFAVGVGALTPVIEADYGYAFAERCAVEKVHTRHILVRYAGAKNAGEEIERTQEEALALTRQLRERIDGGEDFAEVAREHSEDGSAVRGGDLGSVGRGLFQPPFEEAAFALEVGALSEPVETVYGFHLIERLPDGEEDAAE